MFFCESKNRFFGGWSYPWHEAPTITFGIHRDFGFTTGILWCTSPFTFFKGLKQPPSNFTVFGEYNVTIVGHIVHVVNPGFKHFFNPFLDLRVVTCSMRECRFRIYRFWAVLDVGHTLIWRALFEFDFPGHDSHDISIWRYACSSSILFCFFSITNHPAIGVTQFMEPQ